MSKVMITFLGTNKYVKCNYCYQQEKIRGVYFIQEAIYDLFCTDFKTEDKVLVFATELAEVNNWICKESGNDSATRDYFGLKYVFEKKKINPKIKLIRIPEGFSEKEIWEIFQILFNELKEEDEIIFDITHGFRSMPMLAMTLLNYSKFLKNIKIKGIYYGAFEKLGPAFKVRNEIPLENRDAPILDLKPFSDLQEWSTASENFTNFGNTNKLKEILNGYKNRSLNSNKKLQRIASLSDRINKITQFFTEVRGRKIISGKEIIEIQKEIENVIRKEDVIPVLRPLLKKISDRLKIFEENSIINGFNGVKWCIQNDLIQQAYTLLNEVLVHYILEDVKDKYSEELNPETAKERELVMLLTSCYLSKNETNKKKYLSENPAKRELIELIEKSKRFCDLYSDIERIRELRNDLNHAGYRKSPCSDFKGKIIKLYDSIEAKVFKFK